MGELTDERKRFIESQDSHDEPDFEPCPKAEEGKNGDD